MALDRVIVNAGLGKGQPLGTGTFDANKQTAETNFIGALAQTEAAAEIFREQNAGHLVIDLQRLRDARPSEERHDVRRDQGRRRAPRRGVPRGHPRHADQGHRAVPGLHRSPRCRPARRPPS